MKPGQQDSQTVMASPEACWAQWQIFWETAFAQHLLEQETRLLTPLLEQARGYHLLHLGTTPLGGLLRSSSIRHVIEWRPQQALATSPSSLIADPAYLPLPDESMDRVFLHHSLALYHRPHQLLKEAARVVLSQGEIWVCALNPWSWQALLRFAPRWMQPKSLRALAGSDWISPARLKDWCELLDLHCIEIRPYGRNRSCYHLGPWLDPWQGAYFMRLGKNVGCPLRPRPTWRRQAWMPEAAVGASTLSQPKIVSESSRPVGQEGQS